jgi:hypothetical protein
MQKKIVTKISEGLGNQLFMYANSYSLSKKFNLEFFIDPYSGYYKKNIYQFMLNNFDISSNIAPSNWVFANEYRNILKKMYIKADFFKKNKSFLFEKKKFDKSTFFNPVDIDNTNKIFYLDGNFESEKYFIDYRSDLLNEFSLIDNKFYENEYLDLIKKNNVVSICVRQNRFSERVINKYNNISRTKSDNFVKDTIEYIYRSIDFIKNKIKNPKFLLWSNDFKNLNQYFPAENFIFVDNKKDKIITDFYLLTQCRTFIIGPSTFNWWGAWLSNSENKICIRPKNLNPSNNADFWPESWMAL